MGSGSVSMAIGSVATKPPASPHLCRRGRWYWPWWPLRRTPPLRNRYAASYTPAGIILVDSAPGLASFFCIHEIHGASLSIISEPRVPRGWAPMQQKSLQRRWHKSRALRPAPCTIQCTSNPLKAGGARKRSLLKGFSTLSGHIRGRVWRSKAPSDSITSYKGHRFMKARVF